MNWPNTILSKLAKNDRYAFVGGPFGSKLTSRDYVDEGVPVIRGSNLNNGRFISMDDFVYVSEEKVQQDLSSNLARPGDLVFTQRGTLGQVAIIPEEGISDRYVVSQSQMKITVDETKANKLFLYYYFSSREAIDRIVNYVSSSGVPHINLTVLRNFEVPVPSVEKQTTIASILSIYDDLIENNRRRIQLLEQSARMLYKEWFVHLRFPGHEHVKIKDGLPEGWEKGTVADFYNTASGGTPSRKKPEYFTGDIPWVKTQELPNGFITDTTEKITEDGCHNSAVKLFPYKTVLIALYGATVGELGILAIPATTNQACCAIIPKDKRAHYIHSYLFFRYHKEEVVGLSAGAAQNNISQQIIRNYKMVMAPKPLMNLFIANLTPVFDQWLKLQQQISSLSKARDLLLPRLMNGEIAV